MRKLTRRRRPLQAACDISLKIQFTFWTKSTTLAIQVCTKFFREKVPLVLFLEHCVVQ
jgi:hypothetical protein